MSGIYMIGLIVAVVAREAGIRRRTFSMLANAVMLIAVAHTPVPDLKMVVPAVIISLSLHTFVTAWCLWTQCKCDRPEWTSHACIFSVALVGALC